MCMNSCCCNVVDVNVYDEICACVIPIVYKLYQIVKQLYLHTYSVWKVSQKQTSKVLCVYSESKNLDEKVFSFKVILSWDLLYCKVGVRKVMASSSQVWDKLYKLKHEKRAPQFFSCNLQRQRLGCTYAGVTTIMH